MITRHFLKDSQYYAKTLLKKSDRKITKDNLLHLYLQYLQRSLWQGLLWSLNILHSSSLSMASHFNDAITTLINLPNSKL